MAGVGVSKVFGFTGEAKAFERFGSVVDNGFYIILTAVGTIALGFGGGLVGNYKLDDNLKAAATLWDYVCVFLQYPLVWMVGGAVLFILGSIGTYGDQKKLQEKIKELESENGTIPELNEAINSSQETIESCKSALRKMHTDLVTTHLKAAYKSLGLSTHDRVSIYYEHANDFYLLARYSQNPEYAKSHRQKFALNQGVIGKAWQHQRHTEKNCPHHQSEPEYLGYLFDNYGFSRNQALGFAMKSCRYVAVAISDADSHTGVIVFESTDPRFFDGYGGQLESHVYTYCLDYQGIHSKFLRDGLELNREANIASASSLSVEKEFLDSFRGVVK